MKGEGKREASGQYTRTRANFKAKHPKGGEKERREQKLLGHNFFLFLFSSFFFFSGLERVAKHDFMGLCYNQGQSSQVKSSQTRRRAGRAERESRGREREAGVVCTCAHVSVRMFLCVCVCVCVHKGRSGMGGRYAVCVYMFKEALPPTPQVNVGFFARNYYRLVSLKLLMCILIL